MVTVPQRYISSVLKFPTATHRRTAFGAEQFELL